MALPSTKHSRGAGHTVIYAAGIPPTFASPWLGIAGAALLAMLWFPPTSALDAWFDAR